MISEDFEKTEEKNIFLDRITRTYYVRVNGGDTLVEVFGKDAFNTAKRINRSMNVRKAWWEK